MIKYRGEIMEKILDVSGLHCKSCEILLVDVLSEINGIGNVVVDHKKGTVIFSYSDESSILEVKKAIETEGYKVA